MSPEPGQLCGRLHTDSRQAGIVYSVAIPFTEFEKPGGSIQEGQDPCQGEFQADSKRFEQ